MNASGMHRPTTQDCLHLPAVLALGLMLSCRQSGIAVLHAIACFFPACDDRSAGQQRLTDKATVTDRCVALAGVHPV